MTVYFGFTKNKRKSPQSVQHSFVSLCILCISLTAMMLCGTEAYEISGFVYTGNTCYDAFRKILKYPVSSLHFMWFSTCEWILYTFESYKCNLSFLQSIISIYLMWCKWTDDLRPEDSQQQWWSPQHRAEQPPLIRLRLDELGVCSPRDVLTGVVQLVGHVGQHRYPAHACVLLLPKTCSIH